MLKICDLTLAEPNVSNDIEKLKVVWALKDEFYQRELQLTIQEKNRLLAKQVEETQRMRAAAGYMMMHNTMYHNGPHSH